ncbi:hypothetical protein ACFFUB_04340 [Algimonas porphyrae]|uniref:Uncharacterized protein n=1 Tax=Algimonas porphyrae TaxID=1128113 RepID=A0ABQ5V045_9PROT|nr:hypothetical protein [Algimonas porphyrae]GLQ20000.1 hypothetical protein GCM10007854_09550 [Algimonas porphyrae]
MIFRRIKAHIEKENWFAVFIDFTIVVFGVFIGIQVANWNEARVDRDREALILERLRADFEQIEAASLGAIDQTNESISVVETLILGTEKTPPPFGVILTPEELEAISFQKGPLRGSSTYEELKSSGQLRFIRSESLRSDLADFERTRVAHRRAGRELFEMRVRAAPSISNILEIRNAANTSENEKVKDTLMTVTHNELATDQRSQELGGLLNVYFNVKYWHETTLNDAKQVLAELDDRGYEKR